MRDRSRSKYEARSKQDLSYYSKDSSSSSSSSSYHDPYEKIKFKRENEIDKSIDFQKHGSLKIIMVALVIILIEIMFKDDIFKLEIRLMSDLREKYDSYYTLEALCKVIIFFTDLDTIYGMLVALYFFTDPLLAFKTGMMTMLAVFIVTVLKVFYATPRPYWLDHNMEAPVCYLDYSGPSDHLCIGSFFYSYVILTYLHEYTEDRNYFLIVGSLGIGGLLMISTAWSLFFLGQTFLFSSTVGIIYSTIFAVACINQDYVIHKYCERIAFDIYKSRRNQFYVLFVCIACFVIVIIFYRMNINDYKMHPKWLKSSCIQTEKFRYRLGLDYSYFNFSVLCKIVAATFGCVVANTHIESYLCQETVLWKLMLRTAIGLTTYCSLWNLFDNIPTDNYLTDYTFTKLVPSFLITFLMYGIYPLTWQPLSLIDYEESTVEEETVSKYRVEAIQEDCQGEGTNQSSSSEEKHTSKVFDRSPNASSTAELQPMPRIKRRDDPDFFKYN